MHNTHIPQDINLPELRAELARRSMPQWKLAASLDISPSLLSGYLNGRVKRPTNLRFKIERKLGLTEGALVS